MKSQKPNCKQENNVINGCPSNIRQSKSNFKTANPPLQVDPYGLSLITLKNCTKDRVSYKAQQVQFFHGQRIQEPIRKTNDLKTKNTIKLPLRKLK